jgi:glycerophosphoryl diester phosphodiesterase
MKKRLSDNTWLLTKPIAHRGLWGESVIENSLTAYRLAAEKGYPIEIDLYLTTDGELVSFHDATLKRMTGEDGFIYEKSLSELKSLSLLGTSEKIPTFKEVLDIAKGKSPLLIEIKDQPNKSVVDKTVEILRTYTGEFAIQSFNPLHIKRVKKLAPEFIRGILGTKTHSQGLPRLKRIVLKNLSLNFLIKPDFISFSHQDLPLKKRIRKKIPVITWTVTDKETQEKIKPYAKNIIFENFIPE